MSATASALLVLFVCSVILLEFIWWGLPCPSRPLQLWLHATTNMYVVNVSEIDHPLRGFVVCGLTYSICLLFSYLSHDLPDFSETGAM